MSLQGPTGIESTSSVIENVPIIFTRLRKQEKHCQQSIRNQDLPRVWNSHHSCYKKDQGRHQTTGIYIRKALPYILITGEKKTASNWYHSIYRPDCNSRFDAWIWSNKKVKGKAKHTNSQVLMLQYAFSPLDVTRSSTLDLYPLSNAMSQGCVSFFNLSPSQYHLSNFLQSSSGVSCDADVTLESKPTQVSWRRMTTTWHQQHHATRPTKAVQSLRGQTVE